MAAFVAVLSAAAASARADPSPLEARRLVAALEADLRSRDSATETLQRWCAERHLADPARIVARRVPGADKPADASVRRLLRAAPGESIRHRRVALACGDRVLSNADNWYRPAVLTQAMNAELDATDRPFGLVVKPLDFHRVRLSSVVLISRRDRRAPPAVLRQSALLETPDGAPFSLVVETYARDVLEEGSAGQERAP
ncbi:MAG TPA: hypothetical protein VMT68_13540 [Caulobacteraceae bacterium]|nr:hypothetical protein [Caulobacteraceae bacterium]